MARSRRRFCQLIFCCILTGLPASAETATSRISQSAVYRDRRDRGSARRLVSTNGVLHVFVRGRATEPWTPDQQERTHLQVDAADRWIQVRGLENTPAREPVFAHYFITLPDDPFWRKMKVPDYLSTYEYREEWMRMVLARLRASSFSELFDRVSGGVRTANRCVVFHAARQGVSFAIVSSDYRPSDDLENAFVHQDRTRWISHYESVAYAHELLHLYGADDVYNKVPEPDMPVNEIMNSGAPMLEGCLMGALTRYAVSWRDEPPLLMKLKLEGAGRLRTSQKGKKQ